MATGSLLAEFVQKLEASKPSMRIDQEVFKRDAEFLETVREHKSPELSDEIIDHLTAEGRPGSAEYMRVFSNSAMLDVQSEMMMAGTFDPVLIEQEGLPVMIDMSRTSRDMLDQGEAVLTLDARTDFLGSINILKYKLDQHITRTAQKAAEYYSAEFTREPSVVDRVRDIIGVKRRPSEIPISPNEDELSRITELTSRRFVSRNEAHLTIRRGLEHMMRQDPSMIGLTTTASLSEFLVGLTDKLGGNVDSAIKFGELTRLHEHMKVQGMQELQIYPEFGTVIESTIERDFSTMDTPEDTDVITSSADYKETNDVLDTGHRHIGDIDDETKEFLEEIGEEGERIGFDYNVQEESTAEDLSEEMFSEVLDNPEEESDAKEALRLLVRIAIKVGTKVAISVLKNIAKEEDSEEVRVLLGMFSDLTASGGKFADRLFAGEDNEDLASACAKFIGSRISKKTS